jgi:hypothetical protein
VIPAAILRPELRLDDDRIEGRNGWAASAEPADPERPALLKGERLAIDYAKILSLRRADAGLRPAGYAALEFSCKRIATTGRPRLSATCDGQRGGGDQDH